ncbi:MAG TPA: YkgJ family cysteine cluster protein [Thermoanaerobaculia bacterium]|nr:YkgJ family cysteine cluster protein [Thermoanaerobaculia bacterium]
MTLRQRKTRELAADRELLRVIQDAWEEAGRLAGSHLACRPGCTACCHGPFPISALDARRLRRGLAELVRTAPERAAGVIERARAQARLFMGKDVKDLQDEDLAEICERFGEMPCPVLEVSTGRCELYDHRPLTCRTFGPPTRFGEERLAPCDLCFVGASEAEIEAARIEPDPEDLEGRILAGLPERDRETLIAFALGKD